MHGLGEGDPSIKFIGGGGVLLDCFLNNTNQYYMLSNEVILHIFYSSYSTYFHFCKYMFSMQYMLLKSVQKRTDICVHVLSRTEKKQLPH